MPAITRQDCIDRDVADPLRTLRSLFALEAVDREGLIYLDGNSLGALPVATVARITEVVEQEWGAGLIRSWNTAGWIDLSRRIGDKIAPLIGANPGEVAVADSTSIDVFKALHAALALNPGRPRILSERTNFPTDLYIAETLARDRGLELVVVDETEIAAHLDARVAVLLLTHANYRTGRLLDMAALTAAAHDAGALTIWDLAHTAGAVPVDLHAAGADFAVGCGYKYLNGGPGAAAFIWAHPSHIARMDRERWRQPLSGWLGHASPFAFAPDYQPAPGMARFICGTPPILSMAALETGVDTLRAATPFGGMAAIRDKSLALTDLFIALIDERCASHGFSLVTPRTRDQRGSQVSLAYRPGTAGAPDAPADGYAIMQALIARGVIGDFRPPDILRFGFTPLYTRFVDVFDAVDRLSEVMSTGDWRAPHFSHRAIVT
jgi:kynureninase